MRGRWLRKPSNGRCVIFVHGILSSAETAWEATNGASWPSMLLEEEAIGDYGVYVFSYKTDFFSGNYRLGNAVDSLKEHLRLDEVDQCTSLAFVAHSMGGLVVRKYLVEREFELRDQNSVVGLFLVASPSLGSSYANLLAPLGRLLGNTQLDALRFSQDNAWLNDLDKEFTNLKERQTLRLVGKELVEDRFIILPGLVKKQVVEPFAGARYFGEAYKVPDSDHFTIAKPASRDDIQHRLLLRFLAEMPATERPSLPLERELLSTLQVRLEACQQAKVLFRTYHKLAALFAMPTGFAAGCFDEAGAGTAARIDKWLKTTILAQPQNNRGQTETSLENDSTVSRADDIARIEGAAQIDERHLLLALLEDRASGTMREIAGKLGEERLQAVAAAARARRPISPPLGRSVVPSFGSTGPT